MRALPGVILLVVGIAFASCKPRHEKVDNRSGSGDSTEFDEVFPADGAVPDDPGAGDTADDGTDTAGVSADSDSTSASVCPDDVKLVCVEDGEGGFVEIALGRQGSECQFVMPDGIKEVPVEKCKSM